MKGNWSFSNETYKWNQKPKQPAAIVVRSFGRRLIIQSVICTSPANRFVLSWLDLFITEQTKLFLAFGEKLFGLTRGIRLMNA